MNAMIIKSTGCSTTTSGDAASDFEQPRRELSTDDSQWHFIEEALYYKAVFTQLRITAVALTDTALILHVSKVKAFMSMLNFATISGSTYGQPIHMRNPIQVETVKEPPYDKCMPRHRQACLC